MVVPAEMAEMAGDGGDGGEIKAILTYIEKLALTEKKHLTDVHSADRGERGHAGTGGWDGPGGRTPREPWDPPPLGGIASAGIKGKHGRTGSITILIDHDSAFQRRNAYISCTLDVAKCRNLNDYSSLSTRQAHNSRTRRVGDGSEIEGANC